MDLKDIKAIIDLMKKNAISEFELEKQDFKIRLKRGLGGAGATQLEDAANNYASQQTLGLAPNLPAILPAPQAPADTEIKSPMIGTFYRSPSPEATNYIEVGMEVNLETIVCIIEAMKVMNEIKAEVKGIVTQVLVDNAKPVEFGQPMFKIRPI